MSRKWRGRKRHCREVELRVCAQCDCEGSGMAVHRSPRSGQILVDARRDTMSCQAVCPASSAGAGRPIYGKKIKCDKDGVADFSPLSTYEPLLPVSLINRFTTVPLLLLPWPPPLMQVYTDAFDSVDLEPRPTKRPRVPKDPDDGLRVYATSVSGPSGLVCEGDTLADTAAKKTRKRPLSCGECRRYVVEVSIMQNLCLNPLMSRRLKLKVTEVLIRPLQPHTHSTLSQCDRVFPCQSCCKRGCAEICPDGALTGGKGSRSQFSLFTL